MALPVGVTTCNFSFGTALSHLGAALNMTAEIVPTVDVVWEATGQPLVAFTETVTATPGTPGSVVLPHVDQTGFKDSSGAAFTMWAYSITLITQLGDGTSREVRRVTKAVQPLVGQATADLDLLPTGSVTAQVSAPVPAVISVNGQTGAVNLAATYLTLLASADLETANSAKIAAVTAARPATPFALVSTAEGSVPRPIDVIGTYLYGNVGTALSRSSNDGATWAAVATLPYAPVRLHATGDGEMIAVSDSRIHKSSGWAANPATATWTLKITGNASAGFYRFSFDGDGTKLIATEYSSTRADSRYTHISTDAGTTWVVVWDTATLYPATQAESHLHGCCYDPWEDRFWFTEGHGTPRGFYYSDDDGGTWTKLLGGYAESLAAMPTVLVATDDGIVCGTDDAPNGILGIRRAPAARLAVELVWQWWQPRLAAYGFAERGFRDPASGLVYIGFRSEYAEVSPIIAAATASSGGQVWDMGGAALGDKIVNVVVTPNGALAAYYVQAAADKHLYGHVGRAGSPSRDNSGNIYGGTVDAGTSLASGRGAVAAGASTMAVGPAAAASGTNATALGPGAVASGNFSVAVGQGVTAAATYATGVGKGANPGTGGNSTAIGGVSAATGASATAVGQDAVASGSRAVAVGSNCDATQQDAVSVGGNAVAAHARAVVFGWDSSTAADQLRVGARHAEFAESTGDPAAPAANGARLYTKDNGSGKTQLCVRFATGSVAVLATEP